MSLTLPPDALGPAYEAGLDRAARRRDGAFYTPAAIAAGVVAIAVDGLALAPPRRPTVCDPAVGGGAILLAAARVLEAAGHRRDEIVRDLLWGADRDPAAVAVARASLMAWAAERGPAVEPVHVVLADTLSEGEAVWADRPPTGFDVVVGNPPFLNQLDRETARAPEDAAALRTRLGAVVAPYADAASLFLALACRSVAPGGRVALILTESILAARDAAPARKAALADARLVGCWWAGEAVFAAGVEVCAPVLERHADPHADVQVRATPSGPVRRWRGRGFVEAPAIDAPGDLEGGGSWSPVLADLRGAPSVELGRGPRLGSLATATAGFRDQFYGVAPSVVELGVGAGPDAGDEPAAGFAPLLTSGSLDPLHCRWGRHPIRFAGRRWDAPAVDLAALAQDAPRVAAWGDARRVPKVILATQTRVLEAAVDVTGRWWPSVPTIAVVPNAPDRRSAQAQPVAEARQGPSALWHLAAALTAPAVSAWALTQYGGTALSGDAIKLAAAQVLEIPLPGDLDAWAAGALQAARAQRAAEEGDPVAWATALDRVGRTMGAAYGVSDDVFDWWRARLPPWR